MHRCLPLLKNRRKLVFLSFTNVDPQSFDLAFLDHIITRTYHRNAMHNFKD
jgi:hypothetical protein